MPPKAKFNRKEITAASLSVIRRGGITALTARELGAELNSSARPIFTLFQSMEEVKLSSVKAAKTIYQSYIDEGLANVPSFRGVGISYIRFAREEPKLFQLLFMQESETTPKLSNVLPLIDDNYEKILHSARQSYQLSHEQAQMLYRHLWIYCHGIASLCATKVCAFTDTEIETMLTEVSSSILHQMKAGKIQ